MWIDDEAEVGSLVYIPSRRRGGFAWGADAIWTDADSAEEVVIRVRAGEAIE